LTLFASVSFLWPTAPFVVNGRPKLSIMRPPCSVLIPYIPRLIDGLMSDRSTHGEFLQQQGHEAALMGRRRKTSGLPPLLVVVGAGRPPLLPRSGMKVAADEIKDQPPRLMAGHFSPPIAACLWKPCSSSPRSMLLVNMRPPPPSSSCFVVRGSRLRAIVVVVTVCLLPPLWYNTSVGQAAAFADCAERGGDVGDRTRPFPDDSSRPAKDRLRHGHVVV
jgi:hypothetical protein